MSSTASPQRTFTLLDDLEHQGNLILQDHRSMGRLERKTGAHHEPVYMDLALSCNPATGDWEDHVQLQSADPGLLAEMERQLPHNLGRRTEDQLQTWSRKMNDPNKFMKTSGHAGFWNTALRLTLQAWAHTYFPDCDFTYVPIVCEDGTELSPVQGSTASIAGPEGEITVRGVKIRPCINYKDFAHTWDLGYHHNSTNATAEDTATVLEQLRAFTGSIQNESFQQPRGSKKGFVARKGMHSYLQGAARGTAKELGGDISQAY